MPGAIVHGLLAAAVLERWRSASQFPFDLDDPGAIAFFYRGAIAPDMGYFPGGERALSDIIHRSGAFELSRTLHGLAATGKDRAFALGWLTHVLGDAALHPEVNRETDRVVSGANASPRSPAVDPGIHLRVELGLDARLLGSLRATGWDPVRIASTEAPIALLVDACRSTYGRAAIEPGTIARSDTAVSRLLPPLIFYLGLAATRNRVSRKWSGRLDRPAERESVQRHFPFLRLPWTARAFSSPIRPTAHLLRATRRLIRDLPVMFDRDRLQASLDHPDVDLDTGSLNLPTPYSLQWTAPSAGRGISSTGSPQPPSRSLTPQLST